ncbi:uncharacterized protein LOC143037998 [Oratosquilla oratoria]|uniref:uncharacterized protein LOC143037998 n=1 Tax=Oratosquilla oratoria TaxID=337810 RepID=UPI003F75EEFF
MEQVMEEEPSVLAGSYMWQVINYAGNFPLDVVRSLLGAYRTMHTKAQFRGLRRRMGNHVLCPKCNTPWIAGNTVTRLLPQPRKCKAIKKLLRWQKKNPKGLTLKQKKIIEAYELKKNTLAITCSACKNKFTEPMNVPQKSAVKEIEVVVKKKKKKRNKEMNAGLCILENQVVNVDRSGTINERIKLISGKFEESNGIDRSYITKAFSISTHGEVPQRERTKGLSVMNGVDSVISTSDNPRIPLKAEEQSEKSEETDLTLAERLEESIPKQTNSSLSQDSGSKWPGAKTSSKPKSKPNSRPGSGPNSRPGSGPNSRPGSRPASPNAKLKKEKALKIKGLQKALSLDTKNWEKDKGKNLHDFLSTLF